MAITALNLTGGVQGTEPIYQAMWEVTTSCG